MLHSRRILYNDYRHTNDFGHSAALHRFLALGWPQTKNVKAKTPMAHQTSIDKALCCLKDYFEVTILEPCSSIRKLKKEDTVCQHSTHFKTYSIRELIKKHSQMSSPNIGQQDILPVYGLRANYLRSLNTNQHTTYISRSF